MPWQTSTNHGIDSSFGAAVDADFLTWNRVAGAAPLLDKRFREAPRATGVIHSYAPPDGSLSQSSEISSRVYSCFSSTSNRFEAGGSSSRAASRNPGTPGPGRYFAHMNTRGRIRFLPLLLSFPR
jgi:hypothetical protein|eukprot:COSAG01_NODE_12668_length_1702_cov_1.276357_2_plen_125_part_00